MSSVVRLALISVIALLLLAAQFNIHEAIAKMPTAVIGKNVIKLEVAQTPAEIEKGLMFRTSLEKDSGMVFLFAPPRPVRFWMFNCLISLDMIFIKDGKIVKISKNVPPCHDTDPRKCPTYPTEGDVNVDHVVEVNAGYCEKHGINEGDTIKFEF